MGSDTPQYVSLEIAERRGLEPCPTCYNQQTYYMTDGGTYYHTNPTCDGGTGVAMSNAYQTTKERAEAAGKVACPVCAGGTAPRANLDDLLLNGTAVRDYARTLSTDKSGVMVYARLDGTYFHTDPSCNGMEDPSHISLLTALKNGKIACPTCCRVAGNVVYCTEGGKWFHVDADCQGMENAQRTYVALALVMGKTPCPECLSGVTINLDSPSSSGGSSSGGRFLFPAARLYVYAHRGRPVLPLRFHLRRHAQRRARAPQRHAGHRPSGLSGLLPGRQQHRLCHPRRAPITTPTPPVPA